MQEKSGLQQSGGRGSRHDGMRWNSVHPVPLAALCGHLLALVFSASLGAAAERMAREQARELENPIAYSAATVREARKTYLRLCQYCHGADGRAQANPDFEAPSLRAPRQWRYGASDGELFVSIRDGAGHEMPPFGRQLSDERIWELVHYVRSIGPAEMRAGPSKQEE